MFIVVHKCPECNHHAVCRLSERYIESAVTLDNLPDVQREDLEVSIKCKQFYPKNTSNIR